MKPTYKILILIFWTIIVQSCDVQKQAIKTKTATTEAKDKTTTTTQNTTDYTKTNLFTEDLYFEPINPLLTMQIVTAKGDTIKAVNTKISNRKATTDTYNNKQQSTKIKDQDNTITDTQTKDKASQKTEDFDSSFILYIVIGAVVLFVFLGSIALFLMYKTINKNAETVNLLMQKFNP